MKAAGCLPRGSSSCLFENPLLPSSLPARQGEGGRLFSSRRACRIPMRSQSTCWVKLGRHKVNVGIVVQPVYRPFYAANKQLYSTACLCSVANHPPVLIAQGNVSEGVAVSTSDRHRRRAPVLGMADAPLRNARDALPRTEYPGRAPSIPHALSAI